MRKQPLSVLALFVLLMMAIPAQAYQPRPLPTPTPVPAPPGIPPTDPMAGVDVPALSVEHNVCIDDLLEANPMLRHGPYTATFQPEIPDTEPCYEFIEVASWQALHDTLRERNLCFESIVEFNHFEKLMRNQITEIAVPLDAPACYEDGKRMMLYNELGHALQEPVYVDTPFIEYDGSISEMPVSPYDYAAHEGYCTGDFNNANRHLWMGLTDGVDVFIPEDMRRCDRVTTSGTLLDISREYDVCVWDLMSANVGGYDTWQAYTRIDIDIPVNVPPCYDADGLPVDGDYQTVHMSEPSESVFDIAVQYDVCMSDLYEANPHMQQPVRHAPAYVFIPDTEPCDYAGDPATVTHVVQSWDTLYSLSYTYNVCLNRILEANASVIELASNSESPNTKGITHYLGQNIYDPEPGTELEIPVGRLDCYDLSNVHNPVVQRYVCYSEPVDLSRDYTGHDPVISPVPQSDDAHCIKFDGEGTVIIDNERRFASWKFQQVEPIIMADCLGIDIYEYTQVLQDSRTVQALVSAGVTDATLPLDLIEDTDCPLIKGTPAEFTQYYGKARAELYAAYEAELAPGATYIVRPGDTLDSIAEKSGYLPWMLAAYNDIPNPDLIVPGQRLKLPWYPRVPVLALIAGVLLGAGATMAIINFRRRGRRKRKNDERGVSIHT